LLFAKILGSYVGTRIEEPVRYAISQFSCKDKDVENFLKRKAFDFERRNKSRTYLIFDREKYADGQFFLVAYFALSHKHLELQGALPKAKIKEIDGFRPDARGVVMPLIGQFGKDTQNGLKYPGDEIFKICMDEVYEIHARAGGRHVLIECNDNEKVVAFYMANGFTYLQTDAEDKYLQMVRKL